MSKPVESRYPFTFAIVRTFALVCPLVAVFADLGLVALSEMAVQRFPSLQYREIVWFELLYRIPLSYVVLVWPAALAGFLIARLQAVKGRVRWWLALAIGVVPGAVFQLWFGEEMYRSRGGASYLPGQELIPTAAFAVATMVGWGIVRNWYVAPPTATAPAPIVGPVDAAPRALAGLAFWARNLVFCRKRGSLGPFFNYTDAEWGRMEVLAEAAKRQFQTFLVVNIVLFLTLVVVGMAVVFLPLASWLFPTPGQASDLPFALLLATCTLLIVGGGLPITMEVSGRWWPIRQ